jgi:hypothetical protein
VAFAPGQAHLGEIDLALVPGRRLEAHDRLRLGSGPDPADEHLELGETPGVPRGPDLLEEPDGRELGISLEALSNQRLIGIELGRHRRPRAVTDARRVTVQ